MRRVDHSARPAARAADRRSRARRTDHARADPSPRRSAWSWAEAGQSSSAAPENGDVLRLQGFLRRNGHPHPIAQSGNRQPRRKRSSSAFMSIPDNCPSCSVPAASCCAIPARMSWRAASGWCGRSIRIASMTLPWSAPGRPDLRPRFMRRRRDSPSWCSIAALSAVRPALRRGSKITSAFRPESPASR